MDDLYFYTFKNGKRWVANENFDKKYNLTDLIESKELITPTFQPKYIELTTIWFDELTHMPSKKILNKLLTRNKCNGFNEFLKNNVKTYSCIVNRK